MAAAPCFENQSTDGHRHHLNHANISVHSTIKKIRSEQESLKLKSDLKSQIEIHHFLSPLKSHNPKIKSLFSLSLLEAYPPTHTTLSQHQQTTHSVSRRSHLQVLPVTRPIFWIGSASFIAIVIPRFVPLPGAMNRDLKHTN